MYAAAATPPDKHLPIPVFTDEQIQKEWAQASGELLGAAYYFRRSPGLKGIADWIYMAIQMADKSYSKGVPTDVPCDC